MSEPVKLPVPRKELDFSLMKALEQRRTRRKWSASDLTDQELSDVLWAACGVTHQETAKGKSRRTAPSACNSQEVRVYVATRSGLFLYDEHWHALIPVFEADIRTAIGTQKMMHSAPVALIYVADFLKLKTFYFREESEKWRTAAADTGFISQNVYLCCTALSLNTAVLGLVDRKKLHKLMGLSEHDKVMYTQAIGRPPEAPKQREKSCQ